MELYTAIHSHPAYASQDSTPIFGPDGPLANRYQPDFSDLDSEVTEWVQALWTKRVTRVKHSRWNTRWAGLGI